MGQPIIQFEHISKAFAGQPVLRDLSLSIEAGEFVTVIGRSGCGKTTLLRLINRLITPDQGCVMVQGQDVAQTDPIALRRRIASPIMGVCNVLYTIPSISLLGILIPFTGIGNRTAVIALVLYGIMPMVRNTYAGLTSLDPDIIEAAVGMGSTKLQTLLRVKLPMAAGVIVAGVRNMVVMTISVAGIASFVGAGGLGVAIYRGITIYNPAMTAAGSILIALLAIICDLALGALEQYEKKKGS